MVSHEAANFRKAVRSSYSGTPMIWLKGYVHPAFLGELKGLRKKVFEKGFWDRLRPHAVF